MEQSSCLVVWEGCVAGKQISEVLQAENVGLDSAVLCSGLSGCGGQKAGRFSKGICWVNGGEGPGQDGLIAMCEMLKPGAVLSVLIEKGNSADEIRRQCLMAGFEVSSSFSGQKVLATKPIWEKGHKSKISLKKKSGLDGVSGSKTNLPNTWKLTGDDADFIDDDELLTEDDMKPAIIADCSTQTAKKACKDCTCGRAEAEAAGVKVELTAEMLENPQSACGSCGLGDAFRCATCPYRGLPSFEPGKKIELPADFLAADA